MEDLLRLVKDQCQKAGFRGLKTAAWFEIACAKLLLGSTKKISADAETRTINKRILAALTSQFVAKVKADGCHGMEAPEGFKEEDAPETKDKAKDKDKQDPLALNQKRRLEWDSAGSLVQTQANLMASVDVYEQSQVELVTAKKFGTGTAAVALAAGAVGVVQSFHQGHMCITFGTHTVNATHEMVRKHFPVADIDKKTDTNKSGTGPVTSTDLSLLADNMAKDTTVSVPKDGSDEHALVWLQLPNDTTLKDYNVMTKVTNIEETPAYQNFAGRSMVAVAIEFLSLTSQVTEPSKLIVLKTLKNGEHLMFVHHSVLANTGPTTLRTMMRALWRSGSRMCQLNW